MKVIKVGGGCLKTDRPQKKYLMDSKALWIFMRGAQKEALKWEVNPNVRVNA